MAAEVKRTPYIRMDGTRRPSVISSDKKFAHRGGAKATNAFGGQAAMKLPGSPDLRSIAEPAPRRSSQKNENPLFTQRAS